MATATLTRQYRKKPVTVEAVLFDPGADYDEALQAVAWCGGQATDEGCVITTLEGDMIARPGDWIIRGVQGEFYPCKPGIFEATYEPVAPTRSGVPTSVRNNNGLTVADLRAALEGIPDDALVVIEHSRACSVHPRADRVVLMREGITD